MGTIVSGQNSGREAPEHARTWRGGDASIDPWLPTLRTATAMETVTAETPTTGNKALSKQFKKRTPGTTVLPQVSHQW